MTVLTFQDKLQAAGVAFAPYRGADTPVSFGNPAGEFRALLEGCGLYDLSWQAKLVLTGEDRVRWLNGMVTNNVRDLAVGHGVYCFVLTAQGRIVADLVAYNRGDYLLVTSDREQAPVIAEIFDRYIIMDDVEVADISDKLASVGLGGPRAAHDTPSCRHRCRATRTRPGCRPGLAGHWHHRRAQPASQSRRLRDLVRRRTRPPQCGTH